MRSLFARGRRCAPLGTAWRRSVYGASAAAPPSGERRKFTVLDLAQRKTQSKPITMVTAYDASSAQHVEAAQIDIALVGDSAANVIQGKASTNGMTMEQMLVHCESVARQCPNTFVVGDLPFGSYVNADVAVANAVLLIKAGCDAVKLEGGRRMVPVIRAIKNAGIVVIGHVGVTPQTSAEQGGFKTQGRDLTSALELIEDCLEVEKAGASAVVLEMVVAEVSSIISKVLKIPTIGIGAGAGVDGQVLVYHDLLGLLRSGHNPRFAKRYANLFDIATKGIRDFGRECLSHEFPKKQHSFLAPAGLERSVLAELVKRGIRLPAPPAKQDPIERVCVIGGGALGSLFSHLLGKSSSVVMLSSFEEHVEAVNRQGGVLIDGQLAPVRAVTSVEAVKEHFGGREPDLIVILVKSRDTLKAAQHAAQLLGAKSIVLSLQNGIGHADVIYKLCGTERSILGTTSMAAALSSVPGAVFLNGWGPSTLSFAGWKLTGTQMTPQESERAKLIAQRVKNLFVQAGLDTRVAADETDMNDTVHAKLLVNCVVNPLTALYQVRNGGLLTNKYRPIVEALAAETSCVLKLATGFQLADTMGEVNRVLRATAQNQSSMLADVMRGVPTEVDVLNGTIVQLAKKVGTSAPLNRGVITRLTRLQKRHFSTRIQVARSVEEMEDWRDEVRPATVGLVPTMGGLHRGHLELVSAAAAACEKVVVSIYVNPTQFAANEDFARYPRDLEKDLHVLSTLNLEPLRLVVFSPPNLYTPNHFIYVVPTGLDANGEGLSRPGHFRGVATVVLKLFNIVRPSKAFFGQKDGQQCIVVKGLVEDLNMQRHMEVVICPTSRADDGLALSTRNQYLNTSQRQLAPVLYAALCKAKSLLPGATPAEVKAAFRAYVDSGAGGEMVVQYISVSDAKTGAELKDDAPVSGSVMLAAAVQFKGYPLRLIDNVVS